MNRFYKIDRLQWYWLFPAAVLVYALFGSPNTPGFVWWALFASIACGLPLLATGHDPISFVSLLALLHALYYPLAVVISLMPSSPMFFESDLWDATPLAMQALVVGMAGFALGAILASRPGWPRRILRAVEATEYEILLVKRSSILVMVLLIIPLAIFMLATNTYYHFQAAGDLGWSEANALAFGYTGYIEYVVYAGVFLQMRRYLITRSKKDLFLAIVCALLPFVVMLPSGSRDLALRGTVPTVFVAFTGFTKRFSPKTIVLLACIGILVLIIMVGITAYRERIYYELENVSLKERVDLLQSGVSKVSVLSKEGFEQLLSRWGYRFADYVVVGKIVSVFPSLYEYRLFEDVEYWPIYLLPNPIRPKTPDFEPRDSAALSANVGVFSGKGSSPAMILGDLFSRFSWMGMFFGMMALGFALRGLDKWLSRFGLFETLVYSLLLVTVVKLPHTSLFGWFLFFSRSMFIILVIAFILKLFIWNRKIRVRASKRKPIVHAEMNF